MALQPQELSRMEEGTTATNGRKGPAAALSLGSIVEHPRGLLVTAMQTKIAALCLIFFVFVVIFRESHTLTAINYSEVANKTTIAAEPPRISTIPNITLEKRERERERERLPIALP